MLDITPDFLKEYANKTYPCDIQNGDVVACHITQLKELNNTLDKNIIVITDNGDFGLHNDSDVIHIKTTNHYRESFVLNPKIKYLFSCNNCTDISNIISVPIGTVNLKPLYKTKQQEKTYLAYANWGETHWSRRELMMILEQTKYTRCRKPNSSDFDFDGHSKFFEELGMAYFSFCPIGNGLDTYRVWESLYMNTIPLVFTDLYKYDLPIIKIDNIPSKEYLLDLLNIVKNKTYNYNILTKQYWIDMLNNKTKEIKCN